MSLSGAEAQAGTLTWGELHAFQKCDINIYLGIIFTFFSEQQIPGIVQVACKKQHRSWMTLQKTWIFLTLQQQSLEPLFLLFEVFHWTDTDSPDSYWKEKKYCKVNIKPPSTTRSPASPDPPQDFRAAFRHSHAFLPASGCSCWKRSIFCIISSSPVQIS